MRTINLYTPNTIQNTLGDFDRFFESHFGDLIQSSVVKMNNQMPAVDIREAENAYVLDMELPGCDEKNIEVHVDGANLTITSKQEAQQENEEKKDDKKDKYILRERKSSSFSRSFKLPENADPEAVSAAFKNGVLSLQINKRAEAQKKLIQINAA